MAPTDFLYSPTITLLVGQSETQKSFTVHESLLVGRSKNIANALQSDRWQEGADRAILFTEEDPSSFADYLHFVYRPDVVEDYAATVTTMTFDDAYTNLCGVYVLSDMLMDESMKELVLAQVRKLSEMRFLVSIDEVPKTNLRKLKSTIKSPPVSAIQMIYAGTMDGDPIRDLVVNSFTKYGNEEFGDILTKTSADELPNTFMHGLMTNLLKKRAPLGSAEECIDNEPSIGNESSNNRAGGMRPPSEAERVTIQDLLRYSQHEIRRRASQRQPWQQERGS